MSNTRKDGLQFLGKKLGKIPECPIAVSKYYPAEQSWTRSPAWWFDLPIKKLKRAKHKNVYLMCRYQDSKRFYCLRIPISFMFKNLKSLKECINTGQKVIRLHLSASKRFKFYDLRGSKEVSFREWLI